MRRIVLIVIAGLTVSLAASVADAASGVRGCGMINGNTNVRVSGGSCRTALRLVGHSDNGERLIPGTHGRGFTLRGYTCSVSDGGGQKSNYRCHKGRTVVQWSYQP